ncbi:uncharacterized protein LOC143218359 [Lasioglossum baleicum]|uniref:uncharacterized protein LOC143218359 n=1 Tax=Lasioglossum baleicum TaxID=434251 RepID=UPI003FCDB410
MSDSDMEVGSIDMGVDGDEEKDDDDDDLAQSRHSIATMDYRYRIITMRNNFLRLRLRWIRDRALKFMGIVGHELQYYKLLNANNRYYEDKILNFLILDLYGVTDLQRKLIFFYATHATELVQEEVPVWESGQANKLAALTALAMKGKSRRFINGAGIERKGMKKMRPVKLTKKRSKKSKTKIPKVDASTVLSQIQPSVMTVKSGEPSTMTVKSEAHSTMSVLSEYETGDEEEGDEGEEEETEEETLDRASGDTLTTFRKKDTNDIVAPETLLTTPPPAEEKHKYVMKKKMVEKVKTSPVLHMICGEVDGSRTDLQDTTLFYFLRVTDEGIPSFDSYQECCDKITKYLVVGSLQGKFLVSLSRMLSQVFRPLVESQFHGPRFSVDDAESDDESANLAHLMNSRSSVFRRPSEFRRISMVMQKKHKEIEDDDPDDDEPLPTHVSSLTFKESKKETKVKPKLSKSSGKSISLISADRSKQSIDKINDEEKPVPKEWDQSKLDILNYLDTLITNVEWTLEHIEGDILLTMPNIPELEDPMVTDEMLENNTDVIKQLEDVIMSWGVHIQKVLETFQTKVVQGRGPLAEFSYWQDRETGLLMLVEQLKIPMARRILGLLNKVQSPIASNFEFFYADLWKYYAEARDNDRFLQTVVRHFKVISESDDFKLATESISALADGLRMIWILSSYYSVEEKMMGLMERISWQLCQTVINHLGIKDLFKRSLETILEKTRDAYTMLKSWKNAYLRIRAEIEGSGKGTRWEFDQNKLFTSTEYIATVCDGLNQVASVLQDFYNIFGPYLKSIISDPAQIDTIIKRVARLILPIEDADFNIYDEFNKENWEATMSLFYEEVRFLENEARFFIDECFMVLVNAEQALKVLLMFKNMKTRASIQEQLSRKFGVIVQQFSKEVSTVEGIYNRGETFRTKEFG